MCHDRRRRVMVQCLFPTTCRDVRRNCRWCRKQFLLNDPVLVIQEQAGEHLVRVVAHAGQQIPAGIGYALDGIATLQRSPDNAAPVPTPLVTASYFGVQPWRRAQNPSDPVPTTYAALSCCLSMSCARSTRAAGPVCRSRKSPAVPASGQGGGSTSQQFLPWTLLGRANEWTSPHTLFFD